MLYSIAHFLRDKMPWIWDLVDIINSFLFLKRFEIKLKGVEEKILAAYAAECRMKILPMSQVKTKELADFFACQPEEAYTFFKPHGFDIKSH